MQNLILSRILIENLKLKRNPNDYQSYIETFRESLIDANPHQIETVITALEKLESGGCILADEVGLGKTIEAGLVITQYRAKRKWNILIIVPTSLSVQWQNQLKDLFQLSAIVLTSKSIQQVKKKTDSKNFKQLSGKIFDKDGIYIIGREIASRLEKNKILSQKDWDLIIVDEAHEMFANIYRRFNNQTGSYNIDSKESQRAANLRYLLLKLPVLLLTATPIQNNILELWGLASYISKKNNLGEYHHFKKLFLNSETGIVKEKQEELKNRVKNFLVRNLRKDAEVFMDYKFTDRICETLNFNMNEKEKELYDSISNYFERDDIHAYDFGGGISLKDGKFAGIRNLLKLHYRRLLGSSFAALKQGLKTVLRRLESIKKGELKKLNNIEDYVPEIDTEEDIEEDIDSVEEGANQEKIKQDKQESIDEEIKEIKEYIKKAEEIKESSKEKILIKFLKESILNKSDKFFQKVVIFTQSLASQKYLKEIFENNGFENEIVLFSGTNKGDKVEEAFQIWNEEIGSTYSESERPVGDAALRQALIYYFKTRKKIFISTEAGAKGLNLQFCNVIINYDLPWNPQRIEQRIGRCHRYGQQKDVLVINCINADNATENRIYEILNDKFKLFKGVMDTSNEILGTLCKALNFEVRVNTILNKFKTPEERKIMLEKFEQEINEETKKLIDKKLQNTRTLINNLDENVKSKLKQIAEDMPKYFSKYDNDLLSLIKHYLKSGKIEMKEEKKDNHILLKIFLNNKKPKKFYLGKIDDTLKNIQHLNLKNDFVNDIIKDINERTSNLKQDVYFNYSSSAKKSEILQEYVNCRGKWCFYKMNYKGLEEEEKLCDIISVMKNDKICFLNSDEINALLKISFCTDKKTGPINIDENLIEDNLQNIISEESLKIQNMQQPRLDQKLHKLKIELEDTKSYLALKEKTLEQEINELEKKIRLTFNANEGKKLIKEKSRKQDLLNNIREKLLKFQQEFSKLYTEEENKLLEKRFLDTDKNLIFQLDFMIK